MHTVDSIFAAVAAENGAATHLVFTDGRSCSYGETFQRASRLAAVLAEAGIEPGDRVACLLGNSRALYEFFIGCAMAGAIAVPINTLSMARETAALFADCQPRGIVAQAALRAALPDEMFSDDVVVRLLCDGDGAALTGGWLDYESVLAGAPNGEFASRSRPGDAAVIAYSSGTTGMPKGIVLGHRQLLANAKMVTKTLRYGPNDRFLTILPSFHIFGFSFDFLYSGLVRARLVVLPAFDAEMAIDLIEKHRITVLAGMPLMFVQMFDPGQLGGRDVSSMRLIDVGGGPVPVSLVRQLKEDIGIDTVESYGLTEITTVACVQRPGEPSPEGSCGVVLDGIEVRVCDPDDNEVAADVPGELQFRCGTFMLSYWGQPELTVATLKDGWLHTGDIGRVDADGNIFILDRIKDMIVSNGYNVFPKEVENVLFGHPSVQSAAVIGVPHEVRGEDVQAFVVPAPGADPAAEEILQYCRQQLARYKVPRGVIFTDALPLTASGKIRRFALRQSLQTAAQENIT